MTNAAAAVQTTIFTFGYGNRKDYDSLLSYVQKFNITYVIDVRIKPRAWSRKWYGDAIENFCNSQNIHYCTRPALGNTSGCSNWVPPKPTEAKESLGELSKILKKENILLICAEMDSARCHRTEVAASLQAMTSASITHLQ